MFEYLPVLGLGGGDPRAAIGSLACNAKSRERANGGPGDGPRSAGQHFALTAFPISPCRERASSDLGHSGIARCIELRLHSNGILVLFLHRKQFF